MKTSPAIQSALALIITLVVVIPCFFGAELILKGHTNIMGLLVVLASAFVYRQTKTLLSLKLNR